MSATEPDVLFVMASDQEYGPALRALIRPLITGMGPVEAAIGVATALAERRMGGTLPRLVVSLGSAGSPAHPIGSVHGVSSVSWRDMDASPLGFPTGVTPFIDQPATIPLPTPLAGVPTATLSTGADIVAGENYDAVDAELVDMEAFAVLRACQRFGCAMIALKAVSDSRQDSIERFEDWSSLLGTIDLRLASVLADNRALLGLTPTNAATS